MKSLYLTCIGVTLCLLPLASLVAEERRAVLEEVVVTAQKRAETLSDVPLAVSAFSQDAMEKLGTTSLGDSISLIPNMQNGNGGITIRGIGTTSVRSTTPTVAIQVDGIYSDADPRGLSSNLDIERVEVLRGPQGTLYGRNATAGVINLFTGKPSDQFEFFGDFEYSTGNTRIIRFVASGPVTDSLGLRLAVRDVISDGRIKNTVAGEHDAEAPDTTVGRLSLRWQPLESLLWNINIERSKDTGVSGTFIEDYYVSKPDTQTAIVYASGLPVDEVPEFGPGARDFGSYKDRQGGTAIREIFRSSLQYDLDEYWTLTWLVGYSDFNSDSNTHSLPPALVDYSLRGNTAEASNESFSHELNVNFDNDNLSAVAGLYYYRKESFEENVLHIWTPTPSSGPDSAPTLSQAIDISNEQFDDDLEESQAFFAQVTYDLSASTRLTGGVRYTRDEISLGAARNTFCQFGEFSRPDQPPSANCALLDQLGLFGGIFGPTELPGTKEDWDDVSWKVTLDNDLTADTMVYATVSTGYKQGGIPGRDQNGVVVVEPETNANYELGMKSALFDGAANLNFTVFRMDYDDLQVNSSKIINGAPAVAFDNAGKARSQGAELELSWQLTPVDRIDGYITYLDAKITEWDNAPDALRGDAFTFDAAGFKLPNSPEYSFRVSYTHIFVLGHWGELSPTIATYRADEAFSSYTNGPQDHNEAYWRSDFFLRYTTADDGFRAELYVNNIEDSRVKATNLALLTEASDPGSDPTNPQGSAGGGIQWASYTVGRTLGMRLGFKF